MRFLGRGHHRAFPAYVVRAPYAEARASLLARRPEPTRSATGPSGPVQPPSRTPFFVVVDLGLETYAVSVFVFGDGDIAIYSTEGIHSTGLRGALKVAAAGDTILDEVAASLEEFVSVEDLAALDLPAPGETQILVRTFEGDLAGSLRLGTRHATVTSLGALALLLTRLARTALIEGFDRVEAGELRYELTPEFRRIRSTLLDWVPRPEELMWTGGVAGVAVEFGDRETATFTSLFAFADGSASAYRSDGSLLRSVDAATSEAATGHIKGLLDAVEAAVSVFRPAVVIVPPQPGTVQFVARVRRPDDGEWTQAIAVVPRPDLESGSNPLSAAFDRALELMRDLS